MSKCMVCDSEIVGKREGAKTCSGRCQKAAQRHRVTKIKVDTLDNKVDNKVDNYVIPMTRKAALEICKATATRGDGAPIPEPLKRKVFSALHNAYDCRYQEQ